METRAALIILFSVLLPVATSVGIGPIQFGVIAVLNLVIEPATPPIGGPHCASSIADVSLTKISEAVLPFLLVSFRRAYAGQLCTCSMPMAA